MRPAEMPDNREGNTSIVHQNFGSIGTSHKLEIYQQIKNTRAVVVLRGASPNY